MIDYYQLPSRAPKCDLLRLDSPGEHAELASYLIHLGGGPSTTLEHGEVAYLREFHQGYLGLLERIAEWRLPSLNAPEQIAVMFDKWRCHERWRAADLARPEASLAPSSFAEWECQRTKHGRVFLKPLHGSSGSGVCALRWSDTQQQMFSPIRLVKGKLFNSLSVQRYDSWEAIADILSRLLSMGMIAETWVPKRTVPEGVIDVRVLVIEGEARHHVVRQSRSPMTNLHLGNRRATSDGLDSELAQAKVLAERAAACFPDCVYAGVDVLLDVRGRPCIGEINAFGDLLPGLKHRGEDTYQAIARAALER